MVQDDGSGGSGSGIRGNRYRLLGPRRNDGKAPPAGPAANPAAQRVPPSPRQQAASAAKPSKARVLFVCIGNSCRSQMAEGFAKTYGGDVIAARSAGLSPATMIAPMTKQVLGEHNVRIDDHFPKGLDIAMREPVDLVVNMSGHHLNLPGVNVIEWRVQDPIGMNEGVYRAVASQIEGLVMRLILDLRNNAAARNAGNTARPAP
jgi:arsenate reductase